MVTFRSLVERLRTLTPRELQALADRAQLSVHTVSKIRSGETPNPRLLTVEPLMQAVHADDAPATSAGAER